MSAGNRARPGLAEVLTVWILFGVVTLEVWVTYAHLPTRELYNVSGSGFEGGVSRALVLLNFPLALVTIALLAIVADRLRGRLALVALAAAILCVIVVVPGVVDQDDLDAKAANALPALGVLIAVVLTGLALARRGIGASRPFGGGWDVARAALAAVILLASIPWIAAELGFYLSDTPGLRSIFMSGQVRPEPGHPDIRAVHLGHHHGMDGALLALSALALSRVVPQIRGRRLRLALGFYVALMFVYGLANALQDFWLEQLVKRGTTSLKIPSMIVPTLSWAWLAILGAALVIQFAAWRVGSLGKPPEEGVP